jgi:hypothetical protein
MSREFAYLTLGIIVAAYLTLLAYGFFQSDSIIFRPHSSSYGDTRDF